MSDNVTPIFTDPIEEMKGTVRQGHNVVIEGRQIQRLHMHDHGETIELIVDGRFGALVPRETAYQVAWLIAQALAVGEGYPFLGAANKDRPFAPELTELGDEATP